VATGHRLAWRGCGQLGAQEPLTLPHHDAALQQEGPDLIEDAGASFTMKDS